MNERVLIVEDEPQMLRILGLTLEKHGYRIAAAQTAAAARAQIQASHPDLIVLDVMLPDTSGLDLCQELRQSPATRAIPILMLSALGQVADKVAGLKSGADDYVVKPIDSQELVARVDGLLERTQRLRGTTPAAPGKVVSFLGAKGGVGTTTAVVNVATCLTADGQKVICAELRPDQGHLQFLLGLGQVDPKRSIWAVPPEALGSTSVAGWIVRHSTGVQALPAAAGLVPEIHAGAAQAEAVIAGLKGAAEIILLDLPATPRPESEAGLAASDVILLMMEPTRIGLESAAAMAAYARAHARPGARSEVVIINRVPLATPVGTRQIEERLGWAVLGAIPPASDECARSQQLGIPLVQATPDSTISHSFKTLTLSLRQSIRRA